MTVFSLLLAQSCTFDLAKIELLHIKSPVSIDISEVNCRK